jgi:RNA polymerase sigma factor (sigma-70 family)
MNLEKPWLNADGTMKSEDEIKTICQTWNPRVWEEYLETFEIGQEELPVKPTTVAGILDSIDPKDLAMGIFSYAEEPRLSHFKPFVARAIRTLTQRQYIVLKKIYWHQQSLTQIAKELGISKSAVHCSHQAALKKLRQVIPVLAIQEKLMKSQVS